MPIIAMARVMDVWLATWLCGLVAYDQIKIGVVSTERTSS